MLKEVQVWTNMRQDILFLLYKKIKINELPFTVKSFVRQKPVTVDR